MQSMRTVEGPLYTTLSGLLENAAQWPASEARSAATSAHARTPVRANWMIGIETITKCLDHGLDLISTEFLTPHVA